MTASVSARPSIAAPAPSAAGDDAAVVVDALRKRFPVPRSWREALTEPRRRSERLALAGLSLRVERGRCFGVLGANGAGKTTLFRILSGTVLPDEGGVQVLGVDALAMPGRVRGMLASAGNDDRTLFWRLDARANLMTYAALRGLRGGEAARRVDEVLATVGLEGAGRARVAHFSSGMRQRLLVARALLARPRVLLLDEPTRSLDPLAARELRRFVREELVLARGCTVLLATHDSEEALDVCDAVAVLDRGRVLAAGPARALSAAYCTPASVAMVADAGDLLPARLVAARVALDAAWVDGGEDGFRMLRLTVPAGADASARALAAIVASGGRVARFATETPTLATLIERIVSRDAIDPLEDV